MNTILIERFGIKVRSNIDRNGLRSSIFAGLLTSLRIASVFKTVLDGVLYVAKAG